MRFLAYLALILSHIKAEKDFREPQKFLQGLGFAFEMHEEINLLTNCLRKSDEFVNELNSLIDALKNLQILGVKESFLSTLGSIHSAECKSELESFEKYFYRLIQTYVQQESDFLELFGRKIQGSYTYLMKEIRTIGRLLKDNSTEEGGIRFGMVILSYIREFLDPKEAHFNTDL